jgi:aspartokinase
LTQNGTRDIVCLEDFVKNSTKLDDEKRVVNAVKEDNVEQVSPPISSPLVRFEKDPGVTEVQVQTEIVHAAIHLPAATQTTERLRVLETLASAKIPLFLIKMQPSGLSFALHERYAEASENILKGAGVTYHFTRNLVMVSPVAGAMRDLSGIMAQIYEALVVADVAILQTGDSYNAVHCLIPAIDTDRAVESLTRQLLNKGETPL